MSHDFRERLSEFYRRLNAAQACRSFDEAWRELARILTEVEDEMTDIPNNEEAARVPNAPSDGRMYPPHELWRRGSPSNDVRVYGQKGHITSFGTNGAIRIVTKKRGEVSEKVELEKAGADGRTVCDLLEEKK